MLGVVCGKNLESVHVMLCGLDGISVDPNSQRTVNWVNRNYQSGISVATHEQTLHPIQSPAANPDALPDFQEWTSAVWNHTLHERTNVLNFRVRDWSGSTTGTYETEDSICAYNLCTEFCHPRKVHECVAGKQRKFHTFASVTPAAHLRDSRQEGGNAEVPQSRGYTFFMTCARVNGIPTGWTYLPDGVWYHFLVSRTTAHSFALSVTGRLITDRARSPLELAMHCGFNILIRFVSVYLCAVMRVTNSD